MREMKFATSELDEFIKFGYRGGFVTQQEEIFVVNSGVGFAHVDFADDYLKIRFPGEKFSSVDTKDYLVGTLGMVSLGNSKWFGWNVAFNPKTLTDFQIEVIEKLIIAYDCENKYGSIVDFKKSTFEFELLTFKTPEAEIQEKTSKLFDEIKKKQEEPEPLTPEEEYWKTIDDYKAKLITTRT